MFYCIPSMQYSPKSNYKARFLSVPSHLLTDFISMFASLIRSRLTFASLALPLSMSRQFMTIRHYSTPPMEPYEQKIYDILKTHFAPKNLAVRDVSGGCGSMFAITVESEKFKGIPMVKQHRLVNEVLKDEIAKWHGLQLQTRAA